MSSILEETEKDETRFISHRSNSSEKHKDKSSKEKSSSSSSKKSSHSEKSRHTCVLKWLIVPHNEICSLTNIFSCSFDFYKKDDICKFLSKAET